MKIPTLALAALSFVAVESRVHSAAPLADQKDKVSYSIGVNIGKNMKNQGVELNFDAFLAGIKDATAGGKLALTDAEMQQTMTAFQKEMMAKQAERSQVLGEKNKKEGEAFLAANKAKPGVKTTASGLQYKVITEGAGKRPTASSSVRVHYAGTLIDGKEFDSSIKRNEPVEFPLDGVIRGWTEGLQLMTVGSKYQFFIPSNLAYGERGQGPDIGPNSTLIFEVELLDILAKDDK